MLKYIKYFTKQLISCLIVGGILLFNCNIVFVQANSSEDSILDNVVSDQIDLGVQLDGLYKKVANEFNLDYLYVKILHLLAGGQALYADQTPNIYSDLTVNNIKGAFDIEGANEDYNLMADWAYCPDSNVVRPNKYYLPDAAYNVTHSVVELMYDRYFVDRGDMQPYFNALKPEVRNNILFCEAVLLYTGSDINDVNKFYNIYEKILYDKDRDENVIKVNADGKFEIKEKFKRVFIENGVDDERELRYLAIILSFDKTLASSNSPENIKDRYVLPYKVGYTSRENMMLAAISLVGKVRYVWGGGHLSSGNILGINPVWEQFFNLYPREKYRYELDNEVCSDGSLIDEVGSIGIANNENINKTSCDIDYHVVEDIRDRDRLIDGIIELGRGNINDGYGKSIRPNNSWCPLHGYHTGDNACLSESKVVYSVEEYIELMRPYIDVSELEDEKFKKLIEEGTDIEHGLLAHRLDGLDCSGFVSWVYNQIDTTRKYDSTAKDFIKAGNLKEISFGDDLLPGDIFSWTTHIVLVVGKVSKDSRAYVTVESVPNMVKFGVIHYGDAKKEDIERAFEIARDANSLIGNIHEDEGVNIYNMDTKGYYSREVKHGDGSVEVIRGRYAKIGRLYRPFIDEYTIIPSYRKTIKDMYADEIIQYIIDKLPSKYISGLDVYNGDIFNVDRAGEVGQLPHPIEGGACKSSS